MKKEKTTKKGKKVKIIIGVILFILLVCSIIYLVVHFHSSSKNNALYEEIAPDPTTDELSQVNNKFIDKVKELQQENTDVKGWIRIDDTKINYPLLQTTNNDYYLTHNYKKEYSSYGSIFLNTKSNIKDNNSNIIIYGHQMKDGQMFKDLLKYEDKNFYDQHSIIKISTEETEDEYEVVYVFKSRIFYQDEKNVFRFYQYYNFEDENKYNEYLNNCKKIQLYDTGKTAIYGDQLITLITCEYSQENGRLVVVAKKIQ